MSSLEAIKRRIDRYEASIIRFRRRPDLNLLDDEQREWFAHWQVRCAKWIESFEEPCDAYGAWIANDFIDPNPLRWDVRIALHASTPVVEIYACDDENEAARKYTTFLGYDT